MTNNLKIPSISIVVINYNGKDSIVRTVQTLLASKDVELELLVIDDGSSDGSPELIMKHFPDIKLISLKQNTGKPNILRNIGIRLAKHNYIFITDNDIEYEEKALMKLFEFVAENSNIALCSPTLLYDDERKKIYTFGSRIHYIGNTLSEFRDTNMNEYPGIVENMGGGIFLLNRERIKHVGYLNEDLLMGWGEDGEFYLRLKLAGFKSVTLYESKGYHKDKGRTSERALGTVFNRLYIISTIYHWKTIVSASPAFFLFEMFQVAYLIKQKQLGRLLKAYHLFLTSLINIRKKRKENQLLRKQNDRDFLFRGKIYVPQQILGKNFIVSCLFKTMNKFLDTYWEVIAFARLV